MIRDMRRLHPCGAASRGICVDAEGATLGPDYALVRRKPSGYRVIDQGEAAALQKCVFGGASASALPMLWLKAKSPSRKSTGCTSP